MEVIPTTDDVPVLSDEDRAKLSEDAVCTLTVLYGICNLLFEEKKTAFDAAEHLFYDHQLLFAGELVQSVLQFAVAASEYEARLFHEHNIAAARRFDLSINTQSLEGFNADLHALRVQAASEEGRSHAKH